MNSAGTLLAIAQSEEDFPLFEGSGSRGAEDNQFCWGTPYVAPVCFGLCPSQTTYVCHLFVRSCRQATQLESSHVREKLLPRPPCHPGVQAALDPLRSSTPKKNLYFEASLYKGWGFHQSLGLLYRAFPKSLLDEPTHRLLFFSRLPTFVHQQLNQSRV